MDEWLTAGAGDLGRGIEAGSIDPVALTETYLQVIDAHPDTPRIYTVVTHDRARAEAKAAAFRAKHGLRRSALDGVPISWKDLFDSAGVATEAGSALLKGRVPQTDARVLATATRMGTVCLGKTHMSELAFSGIGLNPVTATPPNVNDPRWVPGGSSSGAAASVAQGLAAIGIGSDTGGSVRIPSAWNDLAGLKTTSSRLSLDGVVPLCRRFDTIGPLARTVEDCALALAAMEGTPAADLTGASLKGLRLAVLSYGTEGTRDLPLQAFQAARDRLAEAGATIETLDAPEAAEANAMSGLLFSPEAWGIWGDTISKQPDLMFHEILTRFRGGSEVKAAEYVAAWERLARLQKVWHARVAPFDAVILPTAPILPPDAQRMHDDSAYYQSENLLALRNTRIGNLMGLAAITLPAGAPSCGIMFLGKPRGEEALLRVCAAAEKALS